MQSPFLTIADAVEKTGRSPSTIRRVIHTITTAANHADRSGIEPRPQDVNALKKKGENFTWKIREDVLMRHFEKAQLQGKKSAYRSDDVLQILRRELDLKNQQIEKQLDVIQSLNERLREGNILMGTLQKHLALPAGEGTDETTVDAMAVHSAVGRVAPASREGSDQAKMKGVGKTPLKASRRRFFGWFRR